MKWFLTCKSLPMRHGGAVAPNTRLTEQWLLDNGCDVAWLVASGAIVETPPEPEGN